MPNANAIHVLLWHSEVDVNWIERLQGNHRISTREVLAQIDLTQTKNAGKRRADRLTRYRSTNLFNLCFRLFLLRSRLFLLGDCAVVFCACDRAFVDQAVHAIEVKTRKLSRRLSSGQLSLVLSQLSLLLPRV